MGCDGDRTADDGTRDDGLDGQRRECRPARRCTTQARDKGQVGLSVSVCECRARRAADGSWEEWQ